MTHDNYGNRSGFSNRNGFGNSPQKDLSLTPDPVRIDSFYDSTGTIKVDLFDATAKKVAESFIGQDKKGHDIGVSSTQLRKIFDEVKRFEQILMGNAGKWNEQLPYIKMIKSKVAYNLTRAGDKDKALKGVYKNLELFISSGIDRIANEKDYHVFVSVFEASYGFYYQSAVEKGLKGIDK